MNTTAFMVKNKLAIVSIILIIFAANYNQVFMECIVLNDYYYVSIFSGKSLVEILTNNSGRVLFFASALNNLIFAYVFTYSAWFARIVILFVGMIPVSLLFYYIYRQCFKMAIVPAFVAAVIPNIIAGQDLIPIFINGSYQTYSLIPSLLFFILSFSYIKGYKRWPWLLLCLFFLFISFFSTELSLFLCIPIFSSLFLLSKNKKKFFILTTLSSFLILIRLAIYSLQTKMLANKIVFTHMDGDRFSQWVKSFYPVATNSVKFHYLFYILMGLGIVAIFSQINKMTLKKTPNELSSETNWPAVMVFAMLWLVFAGIPFIFLNAHPFLSRYGYPSAFGVSLLLVALPYSKACGKVFLVRSLNVLFLLFVILFAYEKVVSTNKTYEPIVHLTNILVSDLSQKEYPRDSQIVVVGKRLENITASLLPWSSGFLNYFLKRNDLSGLIGPQLSHYDPFKEGGNKWENKMVGLNLYNPLFMFHWTDNGFNQLTYFLQWKENSINSDFMLYKTDPLSGKISLLQEGKSWDDYLSAVSNLEKQSVNRTDIMWGGELSDKDRQRLELKQQMSTPNKIASPAKVQNF